MNICGIISLILGIVAFVMVGNPTYVYICLVVAVATLVLGIIGLRKSQTKKGVSIAGIIISVIVLLIAGSRLIQAILNYEEKKDISQTRNEQAQEEKNKEMNENGLCDVEDGAILYEDEYVEIKIGNVGGDFVSVFITNNTDNEIVVERTEVIVNDELVEMDDFQSTTINAGYSTNLQLLLDDIGIDKFENIRVSYKVFTSDKKELVDTGELTILE